MKIDELDALCASSKIPPDCLDCDEEYEEEGEESIDDQLTNALIQLEAAWSLIDALGDHFKNPRNKMTNYLRREMTRVGADAANLLLEYNMPSDTTSD